MTSGDPHFPKYRARFATAPMQSRCCPLPIARYGPFGRASLRGHDPGIAATPWLMKGEMRRAPISAVAESTVPTVRSLAPSLRDLRLPEKTRFWKPRNCVHTMPTAPTQI